MVVLLEKRRRMIGWSNVELFERSFQRRAVAREVRANRVVEQQQLLLHHFHPVLIEKAQLHLTNNCGSIKPNLLVNKINYLDIIAQLFVLGLVGLTVVLGLVESTLEVGGIAAGRTLLLQEGQIHAEGVVLQTEEQTTIFSLSSGVRSHRAWSKLRTVLSVSSIVFSHSVSNDDRKKLSAVIND